MRIVCTFIITKSILLYLGLMWQARGVENNREFILNARYVCAVIMMMHILLGLSFFFLDSRSSLITISWGLGGLVFFFVVVIALFFFFFDNNFLIGSKII